MIEFLALVLTAQDVEPAGNTTALTGAVVIDGTFVFALRSVRQGNLK